MKTRELIEAYSVKSALTEGIQKVKGTVSEMFPDMFSIDAGWDRNLHGGQWFLTREEAVSAAEKMKEKRIASLKKQLKKLEEMSFERSEP